MSHIVLRNVIKDDLPIIFKYQQDREANQMAAFTSKDPNDWEKFTEHWDKILKNKENINQTIVLEDVVVGNVGHFMLFGKPEVTYWIRKEYWGKGIATNALKELLKQVTIRPLYARTAKDNVGSLKVLEKCGFTITGEDIGYANARGKKIEELVLILN